MILSIKIAYQSFKVLWEGCSGEQRAALKLVKGLISLQCDICRHNLFLHSALVLTRKIPRTLSGIQVTDIIPPCNPLNQNTSVVALRPYSSDPEDDIIELGEIYQIATTIFGNYKMYGLFKKITEVPSASTTHQGLVAPIFTAVRLV